MDEIKRIAILGAGESGVGAALLAKSKGFEVFLSDKDLVKESFEAILTQNQIDYEEGKHTEEFILSADEIIKSPGIPDSIPVLVKAREQEIPVVSEIEFAARYTKAKIIAITGSNGKTTTTLLTYHLLLEAGLNVGLAGNVGASFAKQVIEDKYDYWVLEVSSFQLDNCYRFNPDIVVILNITPDHLDRYNHNFQDYVNAKFRITQNFNGSQTFIYFKDSHTIQRELNKKQIPANLLSISIQQTLDNGAYLKGTELFFTLKKTGKSFVIRQEELTLKGKHNMVNVMAATLACLEVGIEESILRKYFKTFKGVEHRLEEVLTFNGIRFINDSKATNVDSVYYALDSFEEKIIWIAGGIDKGNDYSRIKELVEKKVKYIICLGLENDKLVETFRNSVKIIFQTSELTDAVEQAYELAREGDIVLLSPACASFDLFQNYEDRGRQFKDTVIKVSKLHRLKRQ